jgi:hypothetical protein
MGKLLYIFNRLKEPSSHIAIMFLLTTFHVQEETYNDWMNVATMMFGILAVFTAEGSPESKIEGFSK